MKQEKENRKKSTWYCNEKESQETNHKNDGKRENPTNKR